MDKEIGIENYDFLAMSVHFMCIAYLDHATKGLAKNFHPPFRFTYQNIDDYHLHKIKPGEYR